MVFYIWKLFLSQYLIELSSETGCPQILSGCAFTIAIEGGYDLYIPRHTVHLFIGGGRMVVEFYSCSNWVPLVIYSEKRNLCLTLYDQNQ